MSEVPPDDLLWSFGEGAGQLLGAAGERDATDALIRENSNLKVVGAALLAELSNAKGDVPRLRALVATLREHRFDGTEAQLFARWRDPDRVLAPGKPMPAFEVPALGAVGGKKLFSSKMLADKTYLLEMWATWCAPCVSEMPAMHDLYARYGTKKPKHLDILSISGDEKADAVAKFRSDKAHPMPWLNGHRPKDASAEAKAFFETFATADGAVPFYVLVDHGTIVTTTPDLDLAELPPILDRLLQ